MSDRLHNQPRSQQPHRHSYHWWGYVSTGQPYRSCGLQLTFDTAVWYQTELPTVPLRWVLVTDPTGQLEPQAFLCTDIEATAEQVVLWFRQRWPVEVTLEEVRSLELLMKLVLGKTT